MSSILSSTALFIIGSLCLVVGFAAIVLAGRILRSALRSERMGNRTAGNLARPARALGALTRRAKDLVGANEGAACPRCRAGVNLAKEPCRAGKYLRHEKGGGSYTERVCPRTS